MAWEISSAEKSENLDECLGKALDMFVFFLLSPGHPLMVTLEVGCCDRWPFALKQCGHSCVLT